MNQSNKYLYLFVVLLSFSHYSFAKEMNNFYIHKKDIIIENKEVGSSTGSIWADTHKPKQLLTEERPLSLGDKVLIEIGEEYLDTSKSTTANTPNASTPDTAKKSQLFPMQIIAIDEKNDVYLKGSKTHQSSSGNTRRVDVFAKIHKKDLMNTNIDASKLIEIAVNANDDIESVQYNNFGWDKTITSLINQTAPTLNEELDKLKAEKSQVESDKKELDTNKKALAEQRKTLESDADRIRKDRDRANIELEESKKILAEADALKQVKEQLAEEKKNLEEQMKSFAAAQDGNMDSAKQANAKNAPTAKNNSAAIAPTKNNVPDKKTNEVKNP